MKFVDKLLQFLKEAFDAIIDVFVKLFEFLAKPFGILLALLEGIFYFFVKLMDLVIQIIMLFVALFQFFGAIVLGVFRTIGAWLGISPSGNDVKFVSASDQGFITLMDIVEPMGFLTVIPGIALAFIWFYFVIKVIGLFGGQIMIKPFGRGD